MHSESRLQRCPRSSAVPGSTHSCTMGLKRAGEEAAAGGTNPGRAAGKAAGRGWQVGQPRACTPANLHLLCCPIAPSIPPQRPAAVVSPRREQSPANHAGVPRQLRPPHLAGAGREASALGGEGGGTGGNAGKDGPRAGRWAGATPRTAMSAPTSLRVPPLHACSPNPDKGQRSLPPPSPTAHHNGCSTHKGPGRIPLCQHSQRPPKVGGRQLLEPQLACRWERGGRCASCSFASRTKADLLPNARQRLTCSQWPRLI